MWYYADISLNSEPVVVTGISQAFNAENASGITDGGYGRLREGIWFGEYQRIP